MPDEIPTCLTCGKKLRKLRIHEERGDYGDGLFCGLGCGYRWGVLSARQKERSGRGWIKTYRAELAKQIALREAKEGAGPALQWEGESFVQIGSMHSAGTQCTGCAKKIEGPLFHYVAKESNLEAFWCQDCVEIVRSVQPKDIAKARN